MPGVGAQPPNLWLAAVTRTASGTSAESICPSLAGSNVAAVAQAVPTDVQHERSGGAPAGYRTDTEPQPVSSAWRRSPSSRSPASRSGRLTSACAALKGSGNRYKLPGVIGPMLGLEDVEKAALAPA